MSTGTLDYALRLSTSGFTGGLAGATRSVVSFTAKATAMAGAMAVTAAGAAAFGLAIKGISGAANLEKTTAGFRVLVGDIAKADAALASLKQLAKDTPLDFPELASAASTLVSFGVEVEKVPGLLARLGDAAKGNAADIAELARSYGQVASSGTMQWEDMEKWIDRGVNLIPEMAKQLGITEGAVKKAGAEGRISFAMLEQAVVNVTSAGGKFHGMMDTIAGTTLGKFDLLKGSIDAVTTAFGAPIVDAIKPVLDDAITRVDALEGKLAAIGANVATGLTRAYTAAGSGDLGGLIEAELLYAGARFVNYLAGAMPDTIGVFQSAGKFLTQAMTAAGSYLEGALLQAAGAFSRRFSESIIEPVAAALEAVGMKGTAGTLRYAASVSAGGDLQKDADAASAKGASTMQAAIDAIQRGLAGKNPVDEATLAELKGTRDTLRDKLDKLAAANARAAEKPTGIDDTSAEKIGTGLAEALGLTGSGAATPATQSTSPAQSTPAGGWSVDEPGGGRPITLSNAQDSIQRRWDRMSQADRAKNHNEFSEYENGGGLNYLRRGRITDIGESNLLDKSREISAMSGRGSLLDHAALDATRPIGGDLAEGSRLIGGAVKSTINPASRAVGNRAKAEKTGVGNKDLTSVLRKIEEHTAKFAELAVA